jgi:soluble lytic murein transglycosylase
MFKILALSLLALWLLLPLPLRSQESDPRELFASGYTLFSEGNFARSEEVLLKALELESPLKDYCLYFLGMVFLERSEPDRARQYFDRINEDFPRSIWSPQAELQSAKISMKEENYPKAIAKLTALRARTTKQEIAGQILYLLGQSYELQGHVSQAHSLYQELRRFAPLSHWTAKAKREIRKLRAQYPRLFALTTVEALAREAESLLRERDYDEAKNVYLKILDLTPRRDHRAGFLMGLADVYRHLRKRGKAIPILTEIIKTYSDNPEAPRALYHLARIFWNRDDNLKALDYFTQLKERYAKSPFADFAHYASARIHESLGKREEALSLYESFFRQFPHSRLQEEAQWKTAWLHYTQGDFNRAHDAFYRVTQVKGKDRYKIAALYWQARSAARTERSEEAKRIFLQIVNGQEDGYYGLLAARRLEMMGVVEEKKADPSRLVDSTLTPSPEVAFHLARAKALAEVSLNHLAVAELDEIQNRNSGDPLLTLALVREYARDHAYSQSVALANRLDSYSAELERYRYPLAYWEMIRKISEERELDPFLVLALIRQESFFDPNAVSPASASGLMQLLPATAVRTAVELGLSPPQPEQLFEPNLNLTLGTHYLKGLLQRYSNDVIKALAAYNAGENALARWEQQIQAEDDEEFIERITYGETRLYVKLVLRNHSTYRRIYGSH